jgi:hypothetical protein
VNAPRFDESEWMLSQPMRRYLDGFPVLTLVIRLTPGADKQIEVALAGDEQPIGGHPLTDCAFGFGQAEEQM